MRSQKTEDEISKESASRRSQRLSALLEQARARLQALTQSSSSPELRLFLARCPRFIPSMTEVEFDELVRQVAAADGDIPAPLMEKLRAGPGVAKPLFGDKNDDGDFVRIGDASRSVQILARAIELEKGSAIASAKAR
jgi:hypothetical protein